LGGGGGGRRHNIQSPTCESLMEQCGQPCSLGVKGLDSNVRNHCTVTIFKYLRWALNGENMRCIKGALLCAIVLY